MENGWIKLHRKVTENPIFKRSAYFHLWVTLLLRANHKDNKMIWNGNIIVVKEGQMITGRKELSSETGIPESTIEDILKFLEIQHQIQQQKTTKYRLITIVNWKDYQNSDTKSNNKATTKQQQADTNKNVNNDKNVKKLEGEQSSQDISLVIDSFKEINPSYKKWFGNTTQRGAVSRMISIHGLQNLLKVIEVLPFLNKKRFYPKSTTPLQLEDNWAKLKALNEQESEEKKIKKSNVAF